MSTNTTATAAPTPTPIVARQAGLLPAITRFTDDHGVPCVTVELGGIHGAGRSMTLDWADWVPVSETISPWWQVHKAGHIEYVACSNKAAAEIIQRTSPGSSILFLARHIAQPALGLTVTFKNDDHLDLRRSNLVVVNRSTLGKSNGVKRREIIQRRSADLRAAMAAANAAAV